MSTTFSSTDGVDKADLLELTVTQTAYNFPSIGLRFDDFWQFLVFFCIQVQITVIFEVFYLKQFPVKLHLDASVCHARHIISSFRKQ